MEKDVALGSMGSLDLAISGGKASVTVALGVPEAALTVSAVVSMDASALVDKLFAAIEKASPAGAQPIEEGVKAVIKAAVASL